MKPDKLPTPEQLMCECAYLGDEMGVLHWLVEGVSPDARDERGTPALHRAAWPKIGALLIEAGADVDIRGREGNTLLHYTVENEAIDIASYLLRAGADINARNDHGETPLRLAVETSGTYRVVAPEMARFLIENGADVSARDDFGETILGHTATYLITAPDDVPSQEIFDLLYEYGALRD